MWRAYQLAKEWQCRPSEILDIEDPVQAYCVDSAVSLFGSQLQHELEHVKGKSDQAQAANRRRILEKWIPDTKASKKKSFKDPARAKV